MKRWINWGKPSFTLCYRPEIDAFKPRQVHSLLPPLQILSISFSLTLSVPLPFFFSCMFYLLPPSHLFIYLQSITIKTGLLSPDADPPLLRVSVMDSMIESGSGSLMQLRRRYRQRTSGPLRLRPPVLLLHRSFLKWSAMTLSYRSLWWWLPVTLMMMMVWLPFNVYLNSWWWTNQNWGLGDNVYAKRFQKSATNDLYKCDSILNRSSLL